MIKIRLPGKKFLHVPDDGHGPEIDKACIVESENEASFYPNKEAAHKIMEDLKLTNYMLEGTEEPKSKSFYQERLEYLQHCQPKMSYHVILQIIDLLDSDVASDVQNALRKNKNVEM